jgi:NTP pyrophosphatase (non-canonical NTP hydrolase)
LEFRRARDWEQFHTVRNVATALSVEAAELLEHFVWSNDQQAARILEEHRAAILSEVADIAILLTYLTHDLSIDLQAAVSQKITVHERKYPLEKSYGSNKKYTHLQGCLNLLRTDGVSKFLRQVENKTRRPLRTGRDPIRLSGRQPVDR